MTSDKSEANKKSMEDFVLKPAPVTVAKKNQIVQYQVNDHLKNPLGKFTPSIKIQTVESMDTEKVKDDKIDEDNLDDLRALQPDDTQAKVDLFLDYAPGITVRNVPDPYYGGDDGFAQVLELVRVASAGLLTHLIARGEVTAHRG